jgi:cyclopropane fatty-acyl-phospholipid synthase-like methyltransferase
MVKCSDYVVFADKRLERRFAGRPIPMETLHEAYIDGDLDIPDLGAFLDARGKLVNFGITKGHLRFLITRMIPEWLIHSQAQDKRIVREHYDRGDDFFEAFLGDSMIYTSGIFRSEQESLEDAQRNKMNLVCERLRLEAGHSLLDIGCGWGTLVAHAAREFGARVTGVTLAETGAAFGNARIAQRGVADRAQILCVDYREIPAQKYDRIVSLEMVEHVGVKNLAKYFEVAREHLKDDGLFLIQWCGLRRGGPLGVAPVGMRPEDMVWGLFMNKYIFPGADASLPLSEMTKAMEKAGFGVHSVENVSVHYALTLQRWQQNWVTNRAKITETYGERWYRLWNLFLGWSWRIALQGSSECFQALVHKNLDGFDRRFSLLHSTPPATNLRLASDSPGLLV